MWTARVNRDIRATDDQKKKYAELIEEAKKKRGEGDFNKLFNSGDTWTVS